MGLDVVAVIVTHNSANVVEDLLDSLPPAMADLRYHVTVVDNGSADRTVDIVRRCAAVDTVIRSSNLGYAAGLNSGVRASPASRAVLVLNPDARLEPMSVPRMIEPLGKDRVGIVAPVVLDPDGSVSRSLRRTPSLARAAGLGFTGLPAVSEYVDDPAAYRVPGQADWALGAVLAMDRACYDELNGWDETYFLYSEETDFCLRTADAGWQVWFEPSARVMHIGGGSGRDDRTHAMQIINRVRLYRRRHSAANAWAYFALTAASECTWVLRGHRNSLAAIAALIRPSRRPAELAAPNVMPR